MWDMVEAAERVADVLHISASDAERLFQQNKCCKIATFVKSVASRSNT
jgi:hypothetical protein